MYDSLFTIIKKLKKLLNIASNLIISSPRNCDHIIQLMIRLIITKITFDVSATADQRLTRGVC